MTGWKNKLKLGIIVALLVAVIYVWRPLLAQSENLEVNFFDVGQGDAILIEEPRNIQVLIDGGPSSVVMSKLGSAMPQGDNTIELLVITHPDKDHVAGLVDVLERYNVQTVLATMVFHPLGEYEKIKLLVQEKQIPVIIAQAPLRIRLADNSFLDILYPFELPSENTASSDSKNNDFSVVARLVYGQKTFLFTGDLEEAQETELVFKKVDVRSDVLKVGHHGSKTSTSQKFLQAVSPSITVISVGRNNRYGHPAQDVTGRLQAIGAQIFRTDIQGDIIFKSDGNNISVKN